MKKDKSSAYADPNGNIIGIIYYRHSDESYVTLVKDRSASFPDDVQAHFWIVNHVLPDQFITEYDKRLPQDVKNKIFSKL